MVREINLREFQTEVRNRIESGENIAEGMKYVRAITDNNPGIKKEIERKLISEILSPDKTPYRIYADDGKNYIECNPQNRESMENALTQLNTWYEKGKISERKYFSEIDSFQQNGLELPRKLKSKLEEFFNGL